MKNYKVCDYLDKDFELSVKKCRKLSGKNTPIHTHEFAEMVYIFSGEEEHYIDGRKYLLKRGTLLFINYGSTHEAYYNTDSEHFDIYLSPEFLSNELVNSTNFLDILTLSQFDEFHCSQDTDLSSVIFTGEDLLLVETLLKTIEREYKDKSLGRKAIIRGCLQILISLMIRQLTFTKESTCENTQTLSEDILKFINANYNEKLTISDLAKKSFYNPAYFGRIFKECYGISFKDYLKNLRITEAISLVQETNLSINDIMIKVGYTNKTEFNKLFIEKTGYTPSALRKSLRTTTKK